jgi:hypothetical protein
MDISTMFENKALRKIIWEYDGGPNGMMEKISQQEASGAVRHTKYYLPK